MASQSFSGSVISTPSSGCTDRVRRCVSPTLMGKLLYYERHRHLQYCFGANSNASGTGVRLVCIRCYFVSESRTGRHRGFLNHLFHFIDDTIGHLAPLLALDRAAYIVSLLADLNL